MSRKNDDDVPQDRPAPKGGDPRYQSLHNARGYLSTTRMALGIALSHEKLPPHVKEAIEGIRNCLDTHVEVLRDYIDELESTKQESPDE
jgi:hypothetical protein